MEGIMPPEQGLRNCLALTVIRLDGPELAPSCPPTPHYEVPRLTHNSSFPIGWIPRTCGSRGRFGSLSAGLLDCLPLAELRNGVASYSTIHAVRRPSGPRRSSPPLHAGVKTAEAHPVGRGGGGGMRGMVPGSLGTNHRSRTGDENKRRLKSRDAIREDPPSPGPAGAGR